MQSWQQLLHAEESIVPLAVHCAQRNTPQLRAELSQLRDEISHLIRPQKHLSVMATEAEKQNLCVCVWGAHLSRLLLVRALIHPIDLLGELGKVWDDELSLKSICQQHDVVAHIPAGRCAEMENKMWLDN